MNIAEAERRTGLSRANIRFYEKEGLLKPIRGENGYRDYTEDDVQTLRKIMLLRRLRLSVPDIRAIESGEKALPEAAEQQLSVLQSDIRKSEQAYAMCRAICDDRADWNGLDVDRYQSITLPLAQDDPREKDRIPPAGCPWRRFFSRSLDIAFFGLPSSLILQWVFRFNPNILPDEIWVIISGYLGWLLTFVFEPLLLHFWGTTPGKWAFGLSVRDEEGNKLSIRTAFARTWSVFANGTCYDLPFLHWLFQYKCYQACKEEELPWDLENGCNIVVLEREVHWYRVALYLLLSAVQYGADAGISLHAKMPPNRGELTLAEFVENCNDYLQFNHDCPPYVMPDGSWNENVTRENHIELPVELADVAVTTDENGYVQSVTVTADSQNGAQGALCRETVYYAFAAAVEKWGYLQADVKIGCIDDGWDYNQPASVGDMDVDFGRVHVKFVFDFDDTMISSSGEEKAMPYHSVLTISKE